jgi:Ca2+:H+ antiporter
MCFVIPAAFFAGWTRIGSVTAATLVTPEFREVMLKLSRGMAIIMLCVYIASRIYQVNPPGEDDNATDVYAAAGGHEAFWHQEEALKKEQPVLSPWWCFGLLVVLVALIGVTAEWLVESIEEVRHGAKIEEE